MRALHITDDVTTCDCCGKSNLKHTVAMLTDAGKAADIACREVCTKHGIGPAYWDVRNTWPLGL